jgi:hypothetical protein
MNIKTLVTFAIVSACAHTVAAQPLNRELLAKISEYCAVREQSLSMMIDGREKGISKSAVLMKLPPLGSASTDAEKATFSRLDDVYGMPSIQLKTMSTFRFGACIQGAIDNNPASFTAGLEDSLLSCQNEGGSWEVHAACVRAAHRKHLVR